MTAVKASDVMDLPEVATAVGWTIQSARVMYSRSRWNRDAGTPGRADLPPPLRTVSGRYPIWARADIEAWMTRRTKRSEHQPHE
ncbi:helix-turn-helix DNA binding domain protein [Gordonia phage Jambalaya]|uniref:Helix-turn-helix DNA binding domain protein n=1 Tax=Gordonia phage Jambalaya TaxID=2743985 RepID=A0A7D5FT02_9CAUD|nr:helix-turn-helix DNA binding domain protein [Gordonia phage Jambalaya]QLF84128.1 helix-turn-helix DNA binding domain protein [Gordonia phage Jambalaya]